MAKEKTSKVNPDNYIVVQGWMLTDLKLKGNALLIYAAIWGFSQGDNQFTGSIQYLADWTNSTKAAVHRVLKKLCDDGLLVKEDEVNNNVKFCKYKAIKKINSSIQSTTPNIQSTPGGNIQSITPSIQSITGGDIQSTPNNIDNKIEDNLGIDNIANKKKAKSRSKKSESYDEILNRLNSKALEDAFKEYINMRKEMKKPLTPYALELAIKDLFKLSEDKEEMVAIVNQSIQNSWLGLFPLRKNNNNTYQFSNQQSSNEFLSLLNEGGF